MATYAQLKKQMEQLAKQAEAALKAEKDVVLAKVRDAVGSFSLTVEEVFGMGARKKAKSSKPAGTKRVPKGAGQAKYADPKTGATWSGFGRAPAWIASAKDRTKFLVDQQAVVAAPAKPKAVKSAAKPKEKSEATKAPATKNAGKAVAPVAPAKKATRAVSAAPAKEAAKTTAKAKTAASAKKTAPVAPKKTAKATAPARKAAPSKAKTKGSVEPAKTPAAEPAAVAQG